MAEKVLQKIGGNSGHGTHEIVDVDGTAKIRLNGSFTATFIDGAVATFNNGLVATAGMVVPVRAVADLDELPEVVGSIAFASDADPAPALVFYNGSNWIDVLTGVTVVDS